MPELLSGQSTRPGMGHLGCVIHDPDRPLDQAREWVSSSRSANPHMVFVFGSGLGYHLEAILERWPRTRIVAYDPDPALIEFFNRNVQPDWNPQKVTTTADWSTLTGTITSEVIRGDCSQVDIFTHPAYEMLFPKEADTFRRVVHGAMLRRAVMDKTRLEKGNVFLENLGKNLKNVVHRPLITKLNQPFQGRPGYIVGSGPGLHMNGHLLNQVRPDGVIIAASSALKPLMNTGIHPDIVVVVEAEDTSHFLQVEGLNGRTVLALASAVHPNHFPLTGFVQAVFHLTSGTAFLMDSDSFIPQGGTSGSAAFTLGLLLGLNPLVLVGQDQAFGDCGLHAPGAPVLESGLKLPGSFTAVGTDGALVRTHSAFAASLHWYTETVAYMKNRWPDRVVLNATESGASIPNVPNVRLSDLIRNRESRGNTAEEADLSALLETLPRPDTDRIREQLRQTRILVEQIGRILNLSPDDGLAALNECRENHPFLNEVLPGREASGSVEEWRTHLDYLRDWLIKALEDLD